MIGNHRLSLVSIEDAECYTVGEVCEKFKLSKSFLYNLMDRGDIGFIKMGRSRRIPKQALMAYINRQFVQPNP